MVKVTRKEVENITVHSKKAGENDAQTTKDKKGGEEPNRQGLKSRQNESSQHGRFSGSGPFK